MNTAELVKEAKKGSASAQKCLFDLYADRLMMVCRRYVKSTEDAEEILLDGFYKFFRSIDRFKFESESGLFAFLKKIMVNECLMFLRKKSMFAIVSDTEADEIGMPDEIFSRMNAAEIFQQIIQLPPGYRTVFNLYMIEGYAHSEIAKMLGILESTSRSQLTKAKMLLQKMLLQNQPDYVCRKSK